MEVEQLDEDWIDLFIAVMVDLPAMQARKRAISAHFKKFEQEYTRNTGIKVH